MITGNHPTKGTWRLSQTEGRWMLLALTAVLAFGANLEKRTALRREPMTDLGVFACAASAVRSGANLYTTCDWHGWHYHYPPTLAILFAPLAHPVPTPPAPLQAGERRTDVNTPWGYGIDAPGNFYGLHAQNVRFFWIVAVWYLLSIGLICMSAQALACTLEGSRLEEPPPPVSAARRHWWGRRLWPLLVCAGSLGTDLSRGQVDILMLAAISLGLYLLARRQGLAAGLCLAFPATVKLFPPLILLYPLWRRRWRLALGVAAGLVVSLVIVPAVALGPKRTVELYQLWAEVLAKPALGQGADRSRARELTGMTATDNQSLLAFLHNWRHHDLPRAKRPPQAAPVDRYAVYAAGLIMVAGIAVVSGWRRQDRPRELLLIAGLLLGTGLVVSPIVHNYYYLLLLPLVAALLDARGQSGAAGASRSRWMQVLAVFMLVDLAARLPGIGFVLRDWGFPLLSLLAVLVAGAVALAQLSVHQGHSRSEAG
jgi:alpha-1,2-mannosyltransferase